MASVEEEIKRIDLLRKEVDSINTRTNRLEGVIETKKGQLKEILDRHEVKDFEAFTEKVREVKDRVDTVTKEAEEYIALMKGHLDKAESVLAQ